MADINLIMELIYAIDVKGIEVDAKLFKYQGFDPETVIKHFSEVKRLKGIDDENFKSDIRSLIAAGLIMGNVTDKNIDKISKNGKTRLNDLYSKYSLKKGGVGRQKDSITLPRILSTFPILASRCLLYITPRRYNDELNCSCLPDCMKLSVFPSLIPQSLEKNMKKMLLMLSTAFTTEQTLAISNNIEKSVAPDIANTFMKQYEFSIISHKSSIPSVAERETNFRNLEFNYDNMLIVFGTLMDKVEHKFQSKLVFPEYDAFRANYMKCTPPKATDA